MDHIVQPGHTSAHDALPPTFDNLVVLLDRELAALRKLDFRLTSLRLLLIEGTAEFIHSAVADVERCTATSTRCHQERVELMQRLPIEGKIPRELPELIALSPETHLPVLQRLSMEIDSTARRIQVTRDAVKRSAETARQSSESLIDLTSETATPGDAYGRRSHLFMGDL